MRKKFKFLSGMLVLLMLISSFNFVAFADDEDSDDTSEVPAGIQHNTLAKGLMAHWKFDGDLTDSTSYKNDGKAIGKITYADGVFGKAASFDGKSYIEVADSQSLDITDSFTISFWAFKEDNRVKDSNGVAYLTKLPNDPAYEYNAYACWEYWYNTSYMELGNNSSDIESFSGGITDFQKWTLITYTFDGGEVKIYNNDDLVTTTQYNDVVKATNGKLKIGTGYFSLIHHFYKGLMDDLKIYNYAFEYPEVEDLYKEGLSGSGKDLVSPPNKLVAYYNFDGNLNDISGFKNDGVAKSKSGGIKYVDGIAGKAVKLDGKSYIEVKDSNSLDLDKAFTIETWVLTDPPTNSNYWRWPILNKYGSSRGSSTKDEISYSMEKQSWYGVLSVSEFTKEYELTSVSSSGDDTAIIDGKWNHLAYTYDGKEMKYYLNGNLLTTQQFEEQIAHSTETLRIGGTTVEFLKGMLDEMKIYNYALTNSEIKREVSRKDVVTLDAASKKALGNMAKGSTVAVKVTRKPVSNPKTTIDCSASSIITSSNTKVVTVSGNKVKAVGKGLATVTIVNGALYTTVKVAVK